MRRVIRAGALAAALALTTALTTGLGPPVPRPDPGSPPDSIRDLSLTHEQPSTQVLGPTRLHDATVMQSMGYDPVNRVWVFAQVMAGGRLGQDYETHRLHGDLTLTKVSADGRVLGYMSLLGFNHGGSIGVQGVGATTYVWLGAGQLPASAHPTGIETAGGVMIAKLAWRDSATVRSTDATVERFGANAGQPFQAPAINVAADLIAVRYYSRALGVIRWAVYPLSQFARHEYAAVARFTVPADAFAPNLQAWAPTAGHVLALAGSSYGSDNPPPGNVALLDIDTATAATAYRLPITVGAQLSPREPEGLVALADDLCIGLTSGPAGARNANVFCHLSR